LDLICENYFKMSGKFKKLLFWKIYGSLKIHKKASKKSSDFIQQFIEICHRAKIIIFIFCYVMSDKEPTSSSATEEKKKMKNFVIEIEDDSWLKF
jgi:hypothetical protein